MKRLFLAFLCMAMFVVGYSQPSSIKDSLKKAGTSVDSLVLKGSSYSRDTSKIVITALQKSGIVTGYKVYTVTLRYGSLALNVFYFNKDWTPFKQSDDEEVLGITEVGWR